jgi:hypothetical protein
MDPSYAWLLQSAIFSSLPIINRGNYLGPECRIKEEEEINYDWRRSAQLDIQN